jgi:hypothetical protein
MLQFLVEAVTLAMVGGMIGVAVGVAGSTLIGEFGGFRVDLQPDGILISLSFFLSGIVFGFLPAGMVVPRGRRRKVLRRVGGFPNFRRPSGSEIAGCTGQYKQVSFLL